MTQQMVKFLGGKTMYVFAILFIIAIAIKRLYSIHKTKIDPFIKLAIFAGLLTVLIIGHGK